MRQEKDNVKKKMERKKGQGEGKKDGGEEGERPKRKINKEGGKD